MLYIHTYMYVINSLATQHGQRLSRYECVLSTHQIKLFDTGYQVVLYIVGAKLTSSTLNKDKLWGYTDKLIPQYVYYDDNRKLSDCSNSRLAVK